MSESHDDPAFPQPQSKVGGLAGALWKDRSAKGKVGVVVGALFLVSVVASVVDDSDRVEDAETSSVTTQATEVTSSTEVAPTTEVATPSQRLADAILTETGRSNIRGHGDRIQLVESSDEQTLIRLLGDENLTSGLTKGSNRRLVLRAITAYQAAGITSEFIAIDIYFPLVDNLGTVSLRRVLGYGFTQERIMAITPGNVDTKRMDANFADEFTFVHPAFRW